MATVRNLQFVLTGRDQSASKALDKVGGKADSVGKKFGSMAGAIGGTALAAGLASFGRSSVTAFRDAEAASLRLDQALAKFPQTADKSRASFDKLNAALATKTRFDDDATASGQAVLAQFNLTGTQIQQLTPLLQDYAAKTGKDLPSAAEDLGKAMLGQGRALKAVGIEFKDTGTAGGNFDQIMGGLRSQVGGFAEAEGKTAAGQAEILRNQFGEVQEEVGGKLVPALTKLATWLLKTIEFVQKNSAVIGPLVLTLGSFAAVIWSINKAAKAYTAVQAALNIVLAANPIGLVVIAIAALVAGFVLAYKKSETFRNVVDGALNAVKTTAQTVVRVTVDAFLGLFDGLLTGAAKAFGWVPGIGPKLKEAAAKFGQFRDEANAALGGIKDKEVKIRLRQTGAQELDRVADEKAARRNGPPAPSRNRGTMSVTSNVVLDGRVVATSVMADTQRRQSRGYIPAFP